MLAIIFTFLISNFYISNKSECNLIVHPSIADVFVENIRENIFILPTKVTNKKLITPECLSDDDNSCHNINKDKYIFSQNINDVLENLNNEKVAYMHRNPFYLIRNDNKNINIDLEIKKEEEKIYKKEMLNKNKNNSNIFYNSINFILDNVFYFFKKINKNKTNNLNQLIYPSYYIDLNKTYILSQPNKINKNNKHKIKGSRLGEYIDDLKTYSFIEPLSLAIDEINFNNFFENIWSENIFNYIFLKENKRNDNVNNNDHNNYLIYNYDHVRKKDKINSLKNYAFDTQTKVKNLKNHLKETILENKMSSSINPEEKTEHLYGHNDVEKLKKINNMNFGHDDDSKRNERRTRFDLKNDSDLNLSINKIFKDYEINEESDFEHVLMNNKKLNIGICTKEKKKKKKNMI
ncbi:hypothetical protein YYC_04031 [Plasmodium yoelii 17X]|uniref:Uncharacterized protein n=1 Tax=Plasmodium yoelii 17X TaxID=1323249 RepID=V7PG64_PLAYE|nr:hypothetical protein YYC_04031 [Plasmodium yoelii 17X]